MSQQGCFYVSIKSPTSANNAGHLGINLNHCEFEFRQSSFLQHEFSSAKVSTSQIQRNYYLLWLLLTYCQLKLSYFLEPFFVFSFHFPFYPLSSCQTFLASHFHIDWHYSGSITRWAQLLITSKYYLPSTQKVQSRKRAELTQSN